MYSINNFSFPIAIEEILFIFRNVITMQIIHTAHSTQTHMLNLKTKKKRSVMYISIILTFVFI